MKEIIIKQIKTRIESEFRKYKNTKEIDFTEMAARKIYSSFFKHKGILMNDIKNSSSNITTDKKYIVLDLEKLQLIIDKFYSL